VEKVTATFCFNQSHLRRQSVDEKSFLQNIGGWRNEKNALEGFLFSSMCLTLLFAKTR